MNNIVCKHQRLRCQQEHEMKYNAKNEEKLSFTTNESKKKNVK